jgi:hypothetical protein
MNATMISTVLGALLTLGANAATYYLTTDGTAAVSGNAAFKDASFWLDANGAQSGENGTVLDSAADYVILTPLRQAQSETCASFGGASLRIGEDANAHPHFLQYYDAGTSFRKLYFTSGYYVGNRGNNSRYKLTADIVVDSEPGNDFIMALSYTKSTFDIKGSVSSVEDACLVLGTTNPVYTVKKQLSDYGPADDSWHNFIFDADLSGFRGTLKLGRTTQEQLEATPSMWQIKASIPKTTKMPGTVVVPSYDVLSVATSTTFTVGKLTMAAGSMLEFGTSRLEPFGTVSVTDELDINGSVTVHIAKGILPSSGGRFVLLSAPNTVECAFTASDFRLVTSAWGPTPELAVEIDETASTRRLVLVTSRWMLDGSIYLATSDSDTKDHKTSNLKSMSSALTNAVQWSNNQIPSENFDYYVGPNESTLAGKSLRTRSDIERDTFLGKSLTIGKSCILLLMTEYMTFSDLCLLDGSVLACPNTGSAHVLGALSVPWGSVRLRQYVDRTLYVDCPVTGAAELVLEGWNATSSAKGNYVFKNADMTGFKGTIRISEHPSMLIPDYRPKGTNQTLRISSTAGEIQLGGKLDTFNPKALTIERCGTLSLNEGNTLNITTNYNRGIYINGDGRIFVKDTWHKLNITTRLTVNGTLVKDGNGPLVLGGECVAEGENPMLDIWSSNVVVASAMAVDGLSVKIGKNAQFVLKVNPDDERLCNYGIMMDKAETPFVLDDGLTTVPFVLDWSGMERPEGAQDIALLTVAGESADAVEAMLPVFASPFSRMEANLLRRDNGDGTVTFVLRLTPKGFVMVLR